MKTILYAGALVGLALAAMLGAGPRRGGGGDDDGLRA